MIRQVPTIGSFAKHTAKFAWLIILSILIVLVIRWIQAL